MLSLALTLLPIPLIILLTLLLTLLSLADFSSSPEILGVVFVRTEVTGVVMEVDEKFNGSVKLSLGGQHGQGIPVNPRKD